MKSINKMVSAGQAAYFVKFREEYLFVGLGCGEVINDIFIQGVSSLQIFWITNHYE